MWLLLEGLALGVELILEARGVLMRELCDVCDVGVSWKVFVGGIVGPIFGVGIYL